MAAWELGSVLFQVRPADATTWRAVPVAFTVSTGTSLDIRMGFTVENGSGPIATGEMDLERNVNGAGWEEWPGYGGKLMQPGHGAVAPSFATHILPLVLYPDSVVQLRAQLTWATPGTSDLAIIEVGRAQDRVAVLVAATLDAAELATEEVSALVDTAAVTATLLRPAVSGLLDQGAATARPQEA